MGTNAQEIAAGWRAPEAAEEGYRANAIIQHRIIWNLPHDLRYENIYDKVVAYQGFIGSTARSLDRTANARTNTGEITVKPPSPPEFPNDLSAHRFHLARASCTVSTSTVAGRPIPIDGVF